MFWRDSGPIYSYRKWVQGLNQHYITESSGSPGEQTQYWEAMSFLLCLLAKDCWNYQEQELTWRVQERSRVKESKPFRESGSSDCYGDHFCYAWMHQNYRGADRCYWCQRKHLGSEGMCQEISWNDGIAFSSSWRWAFQDLSWILALFG